MNTQNYPTWLVPLDIAKKLKEIGFNEHCPFSMENYWSFVDCSKDGNGFFDLEGKNHNIYKDVYSIPTWEQALAWFRAKGYYGNLEATSKGTSAYIFTPKLDFGDWEFTYKKHYEKAREALLLKLIDLYKTANQ
jgi:hypothetical protein|uniref:Uncharacterized protein n=1 Tax=Myoviridae sp. ctsmU9 TaxID=2826706 RepID=A0A8S5MN07_9CAUD|nr:MAG TPA: hypothetical protein [Myoviridae sp. ctsmU9]